MIPGFEDGPRPLLTFILKVLDGDHRGMVWQHLEFFLYSQLRIQTPESAAQWQHLHHDPTQLRYAIGSMIAATREMADMWIDSGKSRTDRDVDTPADRNVEDVLPGRSYSLFQMIDNLLLRSYPRYTEMRRDGSLQIMDTFPRFDPELLQWGLKAALEEYGKRWAAFHFSCLLDSRYSRHISRCDHCNAYFACQRARLRTVTHGVFCPACEGQGSMKRTEISRARRYDTAAKARIEWESRRKESVPPEWIAEQVNKAHGTPFGRRWVSQNLSEILKRVEALRNAKG
ncbi:MAG: hypothetical protein WCF30_00600 [Terracidiphilus sp.]